MTNIREGLTLPGLTNWYGLCNLFTYICYTYIWHLVHAVLLVVLRNVVQSISNHCVLYQLTRASLHVSSSTPHLQSRFKLVQSSFFGCCMGKCIHVTIHRQRKRFTDGWMDSELMAVYNSLPYMLSPTWRRLTVVAKEVETLIDIVQRVCRHCVYVPLIHLIYALKILTLALLS